MELRLSAVARIGLISFAAITAVLFAFLLARFGGPSIRITAPRRVAVTLADSQGIGPGADVLVRGVRVGRVGNVAMRRHSATLTLELNPAGPALHADASAQIGTKTALGETFVALDPGHPGRGPLPPGAPAAGRPSVQFDEALGVLDAPARRDLSAVVKHTAQAAAAPDAPEQIDATMAQLGATVAALRDLTATLRGQAREIAATVKDGRTVLAQLGEHDTAIHAIVADGRRTLAGLSVQRQALGRGLEQLPGVLRAARATLVAARPLIPEAIPLVRDLERAAPALSRSLVALGPALRDVSGVLGAAPQLSASARPALASLNATLPTLDRSARSLGPALADVVPMVRYLSPRANTIAAWFANTADLGSHGDAKGDWARFFVFGDPASAFGAPGAPPGNSYTRPGDAAANQPYRPGDYPRLTPYRP